MWEQRLDGVPNLTDCHHRDFVLGSLVQFCGSRSITVVVNKLVAYVDGVFDNELYDDIINAESQGDGN